MKDDFISTLRQGASRCSRIFPCLIEPYADVQKRALLTLKGSDMWRKVLSQGDLWGGTNVTLIMDAEYAIPIDRTMKALAAIRQVFETTGYAQRTLGVVGIRFVRASSALMACHYSADPNEIFAYLNVQYRTKTPKVNVMNDIQTKMIKMGARPHWGKYNTTTREAIESFDSWPSQNMTTFVRVKKKYDPSNHLLGNKYLDRALGLDATAQGSKTSMPNRKYRVQATPSQGVEVETGSF